MKRSNCLICGSKKLTEILDLGSHPFADTFLSKDDHNNMLPVYNLSCVMCEDCKHIQTESITDPSERYNLFDYSYTSSNSSTSRNHWNAFSKHIIEKLCLSKDSKICEIGSNDGYLLNQFKKSLNNNVLGVDASKSMCDIANQNGILTKWCIFNKLEADSIVNDYEKFDLVIANNVYNHSDNPISFTEGVNKLLKQDGFFVFEVPYWKNTIDSKKIDQVYHEHVSYFTVKSLSKLLTMSGFSLEDVTVVDYHGGSLRVIAKKTNQVGLHTEVEDMIKKENYLFSKNLYENLSKELKRRKVSFVSKILNYKSNGYEIIAIGAAAKGNTLLNFLNLNNSVVDYVTDASEFKQGKRTPLSNIEIFSDDRIKTSDKVCAIILSWNLSDFIKNKIRELNPKIEYINFYEQEIK